MKCPYDDIKMRCIYTEEGMIFRTRKYLCSEQLRLAYRISVQAHLKQVDKCGDPYILHPLAVALSVRSAGWVAECAALLHDVVEDNKDWSCERLLREGVHPEVVVLVDLLTRKEDETYFGYIARTATNATSAAIKIADILHNTDPSRSFSDTESLRPRYTKALKLLGTGDAELV